MQLTPTQEFPAPLTVSFSRVSRARLAHLCLFELFVFLFFAFSVGAVPMMNHHTMPKFGFGPYKTTHGVGTFYLPKILNSTRGSHSKVALEFSHANSKKYATSIPLPSDKLDSNKRYLVTFTLKDNENPKEIEDAADESK